MADSDDKNYYDGALIARLLESPSLGLIYGPEQCDIRLMLKQMVDEAIAEANVGKYHFREHTKFIIVEHYVAMADIAVAAREALGENNPVRADRILGNLVI